MDTAIQAKTRTKDLGIDLEGVENRQQGISYWAN